MCPVNAPADLNLHLTQMSEGLLSGITAHDYYRHVKKSFHTITKTHLFKYIENFSTKKWKFSDKNSDIFHISAQNIDSGYLLELPHWGISNEYPQSMFLSRNK